jgi:hypothetical protein
MGFTEGNWNNDFTFGKKWEKKALELLDESQGCAQAAEQPPEGKFSDWDFRYNGRGYEVKSDRRAYQTGNLCFEYEHTGIPSGIRISKADEWIYFVVKPNGYDVYRIPLEDIRAKCDAPGTRQFYCDGGNSKFYLLPINTFTEYKWRSVIEFKSA